MDSCNLPAGKEKINFAVEMKMNLLPMKCSACFAEEQWYFLRPRLFRVESYL